MTKLLVLARAVLLALAAGTLIAFVGNNFNLAYLPVFIVYVVGVWALSKEIKQIKELEEVIKKQEEAIKQIETAFNKKLEKINSLSKAVKAEVPLEEKTSFKLAMRDPRYARIKEDIKRLQAERGIPTTTDRYWVFPKDKNGIEYKKPLYDLGAISIKTQLEFINDTHQDKPGCICTKCFITKYKSGPTA